MNRSGHRLAWLHRHAIPTPPAMAYATEITFGNAIEPYRVVERVEFSTELAANLYGATRCPELPPYHHWMPRAHATP